MRLASPTLVVLFAAGLVFLLPGLQPLLIYDRNAILAGEVWRLFTGHWVHFSTQHLGVDLFVFGLTGFIVESRNYPSWRALLLSTPGLLGLGLLVAEPRLELYGGLSGLATAAVVYLALSGVKEPSPWRWVCRGTLLMVALKIIFEWSAGHALFVGDGGAQFVPVPLSHLLGALSAIFVWLLSKERQSPPWPNPQEAKAPVRPSTLV